MKNKDLVIGDTSQVAQYFSSECTKVSARNIPSEIYDVEWDNVYLCFAEQRTSLAHQKEYKDFFYSINIDLTLDCVERIKSNRIVCFSTSELWNRCSGAIDMKTPYNYEENYYTDSKMELTQKLGKYENVVVLFPFNFNSIYRKNTFLFSKIYQSLITGEKIKIGNTHIYRDIIHAKYVAEKAQSCTEDEIVGSGRLTHVNDFIRDLFLELNYDYDIMVEETKDIESQKNIFWYKAKECLYSYDNLVSDSLKELYDQSR